MESGVAPRVELSLVGPQWQEPLAQFFKVLVESGDEKFFHPHPLTVDAARELATYSGMDLYYVAVDGRTVLAYGMLRGWDMGFEMPSLGIALLPSMRGTGLAAGLMHFLHAVARMRGCSRVRLTVAIDNTRAVALYRRLGYMFAVDPKNPARWLGIHDLN
jgi:ribosomal protein S18 acetylase RimI-like enzyme